MRKPSIAKRIEARLQGTIATPEDIKHFVKLNKCLKQYKANIKLFKKKVSDKLALINRKNPTVMAVSELLVLTAHLRDAVRSLQCMQVAYNIAWKTYSQKPKAKKAAKKSTKKTTKK